MVTSTETRPPLPGLDSAPDVYATPDFDQDVTEESTTSSLGQASESDTSHEDAEEDFGISRRRLYPERARSRFRAHQRRGNTTAAAGAAARRRHLGDDDDDDDEPETLDAKIARLRREVEECRLEARAEQQAPETDETNESGTLDAIEALSRIMSGLDTTPTTSKPRGHARMRSAYHDAPTIPPSSTSSEPQSPPLEQRGDHPTLTNITAFDARLATIETALGLSTLSSTAEESALTSPLLPTIALLDHQIATLTTATSLEALEAVATKIQTLKSEAAELSQLPNRHHPPPPQPAAQSKGTSDEDGETNSESEMEMIPAPALSAEDMASLQQLYSILPTLQSLAPMIPALTNRLRSLRTIHTAAASAHKDLNALEERQGEMDQELRMWRQGLEKVEEAVGNAQESNAKNGKFVKLWVDELEGRVKGLRR